MLCTNEHISLLANLLAEYGAYDYSPELAARDLFFQNAATVGQVASGANFRYIPTIDPASRSKIELLEALITYRQQCSAYPMWDKSLAKLATDKAIAGLSIPFIEKLQGYGGHFFPREPEPIIDITQILPNSRKASCQLD